MRQMSDHHESRLLLAVLQGRWEHFDRLLDERAPEPSALLRLARECDVFPYVHARLAESGRLPACPAEVAETLAAWRHKTRIDNLVLLDRTEAGLDALLAAGVVPLALKGLDLLHRAYGSFDERTLDDVDLLIRHEDLHACLDALARAGWGDLPQDQRDHYLRSSHHLPLPHPGPPQVDFEIHWNLAQTGRFRIAPEGLFERAQPLTVSGRQILRMDDHDLVAHLLLHHFTHYFDRRMKWSVDMHWLVSRPGFDWGRVCERLHEWGATAASGMSIKHLRKVFPDWIPASAEREVPVAAWRNILTAPLRSSHPLDMFLASRNRRIQLYLAAVLMENPLAVPGWLIHRIRRDRQPELSPLETSKE
ncbi:hypothetical protein ABI59_04725 [Acidobacteria bacterium Mor1]|nr:hypothetical protein ABI59_04725 [Acidobacteria bacterium Mor1]